ncbi:hypothetical protein GE061_015644 [Apolygus lucorum]|uniref:Uncharacterized protein n=1 Tax=Apolygus lucorum TaxID=248454 RepID=A0A6A4J1P8_APOLU|nr:hypothetical protein GE061_015644 [Apolygus lucorum]
MRESSKTGEESGEDTSSTEGLIEDEDEEQEEPEKLQKDAEVVDLGLDSIQEDIDLLDSAFLRDGITLEQGKESSQSDDDSDGLYDFKDTLGVQQFPADLDYSKKHFLLNPRQPRQCEYLYGKRYTARCVRRVDPSQLPSLMSLKVEPPERAATSNRTQDEDSDLSKLVMKLQRPPGRRRRNSPDVSRRKRSPDQRGRPRSRSPRRLTSRERIHRSPTGIERYRYWTGREYRSRNRSPPHRRSRHQ